MNRRLWPVLAGLGGVEALGSLVLDRAARDLLAQLASPGALPLDPALGLAAAALAWLVLTWLVVTTGLAAVAQSAPRWGLLRAFRSADRCSPALARRAAALLLGAGLAGSVVVPTPAWAEHRNLARTAAQLSGWSADRPAANGHENPAHDQVVVGRDDEVVVVRRGDTLWDIAARHLGPRGEAADVAAAWPRWHAANRAVIGARPDLILPGQVLRPPAS